MSPILVRPVREQLEHDRVIRLLQAKYKRKFEVGINPGNEQTAPVGPGPSPWLFPDLVLQSPERSRKLLGIVEVETAESVNNLEAMSQWVAFSRLRAPFHLYVPAASIDVARRLCVDLHISVAEIWAYHTLGDQMRFTLIQRASQSGDGKGTAAATASRRAPAGGPRPSRPAAARPATARPAVARPAAAARPTTARSTRGAAQPAAGRRKVAAKKATTSRGGVVRKTASRPARAQKRK